MRIIRNQSTAGCPIVVMGRSRNRLHNLANERNTRKTKRARLWIEHRPELEIRIEIDVRMESAAVHLFTQMIMKMPHTLTSLSHRGPYLHHRIEKADLDECPAAPYIEQVHAHYAQTYVTTAFNNVHYMIMIM